MQSDHTEFLTAVDISLSEIANQQISTETFSTYRELTRVKLLWKSMILQFRTIIIVFAGMNKDNINAEEKNIDIIYE